MNIFASALSSQGLIVAAGIVALTVFLIFILDLVRAKTYLPTMRQIFAVQNDIKLAHSYHQISHKGNLYFSYPPTWGVRKLGKEGYELRPKGLGIPCSLKLFVVDRDPKFSDTSFWGMVRNAEELAKGFGSELIRESICEQLIAGENGIEFLVVDRKGNKRIGFLWCYEQGDYLILVETLTFMQLQTIQPVIRTFIQYCHMRPLS